MKVSRDSSFLLAQQQAEVERERPEGRASRLYEASYHSHGGGVYGRHPHHHEPAYLEMGNPYGGGERHHHLYGRHHHSYQGEYQHHHYYDGRRSHHHRDYQTEYEPGDEGQRGRYGRQGAENSSSMPEFSNPFASLFGGGRQTQPREMSGYDKEGEYIANLARHFAYTNPRIKGPGGYGECSKIPRKVLNALGIPIDKMSGVHQGETLENCGLFERVPASQAKPGDFGYRHWRYRAGDLGDSFVVTGHGADGSVIAVNGASRHDFVVSNNGGYYTDAIFLRPTAEFYRRYGRRIAQLSGQESA